MKDKLNQLALNYLQIYLNKNNIQINSLIQYIQLICEITEKISNDININNVSEKHKICKNISLIILDFLFNRFYISKENYNLIKELIESNKIDYYITDIINIWKIVNNKCLCLNKKNIIKKRVLKHF